MNLEDLCPGIRACVAYLNKVGFETTDSGDGSHFAAGMECAWEEPMVVIQATEHTMVGLSRQLHRLVHDKQNLAGIQIEATYSPVDGVASVIAYGPELVHVKDPRDFV